MKSAVYPHVIRLRGPWEYAIAANTSMRSRIKLPDDWPLLATHVGRAPLQLRRVFHLPSGLQPQERVWLICRGLQANDFVRCNDHLLSGPELTAGVRTLLISPLLTSQNELLIELTGEIPAEPPDVSLEIRELQYVIVQDLDVRPANSGLQLHFTGSVQGEPAGQALELIVRTPDEELIAAEVAVGEAFSFVTPLPRELCTTSSLDLHLRLIRGATRIWEAHRRLPLA